MSRHVRQHCCYYYSIVIDATEEAIEDSLNVLSASKVKVEAFDSYLLWCLNKYHLTAAVSAKSAITGHGRCFKDAALH